MNSILYINPRTLAERTIKVGQYSHDFMQRWWHSNPFTRGNRRPTMREADDLLLQQGFIRLRSPEGNVAARIKRLKNALTDNATLASGPRS